MCYLLQGIYDLIARKYCYPPCCNSFCYWGLNVLLLSSSNFWACATSLHLGWHAHPGNGSAGKSNHITTSPETSADCLKIVLGLTEGMGEAIRYAAHNAPASHSLWPHTQADVLLTKQQQAKSLWRAGSGPLRRRPRQEQLGHRHVFMLQATHV